MAGSPHVFGGLQDDSDLDDNNAGFKNDSSADEQRSEGSASKSDTESGVEEPSSADEDLQPHQPLLRPQDDVLSEAVVDHSLFGERLRMLNSHVDPTSIVTSKIDAWYNQAATTVTITEISLDDSIDDDSTNGDNEVEGPVCIIRDITGVLLSFPMPPGDKSSEDSIIGGSVFSDSSSLSSTATSPWDDSD